MTRRWKESAARARCYAAASRSRRALVRSSMRFEWLRRRGGRGGMPRIALNLRFGMALDLRFHGGIRARPVAGRDGAPGRAAVSYRPVQATHLRSLLSIAAVASRKDAQRPRREQTTHTKNDLTIVHERPPHARALLQTVITEAARVIQVGLRERSTRGEALGRTARTDTTAPSSPTLAVARALLNRTRVVDRLETRHLDSVSARVESRAEHTTNTLVRRGSTPAGSTARSPMPLDVVARAGRASLAAAAARVFAAQPQPLAAPQRQPAAEPVPVERIEQRLRESITVVAERTVKRELERTLRPGAPMNRRLRESIQSEMYDDIVFERERRGDH